MGKKILVVDDSSLVRDMHSFMLRSGGFDVDTAENGHVAFEKILQNQYDVLVTDINMPVLDGFALCKDVRANDKTKDLPIILISTRAEAEDKMKGFSAGANLYIVKPVKAEELIESVSTFIDG